MRGTWLYYLLSTASSMVPEGQKTDAETDDVYSYDVLPVITDAESVLVRGRVQFSSVAELQIFYHYRLNDTNQ